MSQQEVAKMFSSDGWVCFRAFDSETRAPRLLPQFLMPSVPTASTSTWKNKTERAAIKAAKIATIEAKNGNTGNNNLIGTNPSSHPQQQQWNNLTLQGASTITTTTANDPLTPLAATFKQKKRKNYGIADNRFDLMFPSPPGSYKVARTAGTPATQEAMDAKSGKGKSRRRTFGPIIKSSQRCGMCKPCLNPGWKKPCDVRRAEMLAKLQEEQNARHEQEQQQNHQHQIQQQQQQQQQPSAVAQLAAMPPSAPGVISPIIEPIPASHQ